MEDIEEAPIIEPYRYPCKYPKPTPTHYPPANLFKRTLHNVDDAVLEALVKASLTCPKLSVRNAIGTSAHVDVFLEEDLDCGLHVGSCIKNLLYKAEAVGRIYPKDTSNLTGDACVLAGTTHDGGRDYYTLTRVDDAHMGDSLLAIIYFHSNPKLRLPIVMQIMYPELDLAAFTWVFQTAAINAHFFPLALQRNWVTTKEFACIPSFDLGAKSMQRAYKAMCNTINAKATWWAPLQTDTGLFDMLGFHGDTTAPKPIPVDDAHPEYTWAHLIHSGGRRALVMAVRPDTTGHLYILPHRSALSADDRSGHTPRVMGTLLLAHTLAACGWRSSVPEVWDRDGPSLA